MRKTIICLIVGFSCSTLAFSQEGSYRCKGFFRWDVKTLTDSGALTLLHAVVYDSTFDQLVAVKPPAKLFVLSAKDGHLPRFGNEKYLVRLKALIQKVNIQNDKDYHILLQSPDSEKYMIAEIPDPSCTIFDSLPVLREAYASARKQMEEVISQLEKGQGPVLVEITGVPFWDARHWWLRGCARNGREIHPVLSVRILTR